MRRRIFLSLVFLVFALNFSTQAWHEGARVLAQSAEEDLYRLAKSKDWLQRVEGIANGYLNLILESTQLDDVSYGLSFGEITEAQARQQGEAMLRALHGKYEAIKQAHAKLPPPPEFSNSRLEAILDGQIRYLGVLQDQTGETLDLSAEIFQASLAGDDTVQTKMMVRQFNQMIAFLEAENMAVRQQLSNLKANQPMHALLTVFIHTNDAIVSVFGTLAEVVGKDLAAVTRVDAQSSAKEHLLLSQKQIGKGRLLTVTQKTQVAGMRTNTESEKTLKRVALKLIGTLEESFDVEQRLLDLIDRLSETLSGTDLANLSDAEFDAFDRELQALVDRRLELQQARTAMLGELQ